LVITSIVQINEKMQIIAAVILSNSHHMNVWMLFVMNIVLLFLELRSKCSCQFNLDVYFADMMDLCE